MRHLLLLGAFFPRCLERECLSFKMIVCRRNFAPPTYNTHLFFLMFVDLDLDAIRSSGQCLMGVDTPRRILLPPTR